jgi:hypothetical protein
VLAELAFDGLERGLGDRGLMIAQLLAVALALWVLARDATRDGAGADGVCAALLLAAAGAFPSLAIIRVQLFSLPLFAVLVALLRSEARAPSRRVWLAPALLALWANLHGAVLVGLGVALVYLLLERARGEPATALAAAAACVLALFLTPALTDTVSYYHGVLTNAAARRGFGLWTPLALDAPFDDLAILASLGLAWRWRKAHPRLWEVVVALALALLTLRTSRSAVWLLLFLIAPAARSITGREWGRLIAPTMLVAVVLTAVALIRGPSSDHAERALVARAVSLARGSPVLAPDILAEQVALDGGRVWLGNPLDAFPRGDQEVYLDWLQGRARGAAALTPATRVVLASRDGATEKLMRRAPAYAAIARTSTTILYVRTR